MTYNTRNQSNDTTESQKEKKTYFNAHFSTVSQKSRDYNNIYISILCVCVSEHGEVF